MIVLRIVTGLMQQDWLHSRWNFNNGSSVVPDTSVNLQSSNTWSPRTHQPSSFDSHGYGSGIRTGLGWYLVVTNQQETPFPRVPLLLHSCPLQQERLPSGSLAAGISLPSDGCFFRVRYSVTDLQTTIFILFKFPTFLSAGNISFEVN
jgi:hypothetical protein